MGSAALAENGVADMVYHCHPNEFKHSLQWFRMGEALAAESSNRLRRPAKLVDGITSSGDGRKHMRMG